MDRKPFIYIQFKTTIESDDEFNKFIEFWKTLYEQKEEFYFCFDTREFTETPSLSYCYKIAAFIKHLKKQKEQYLKKSIIILNNSIIKSLLKIIFSIQKPISPVYIYNNTQSSISIKTLFKKVEDNDITDFSYISNH